MVKDATAVQGRFEAVSADRQAEPKFSDAEMGLWMEYGRTKSEQLREELVERYLPLVRYVAGRVASRVPQTVDFDDILSWGIIGLLKAVEVFDIRRNIKFETYASSRIRGAILDALREQDFFSRTVRQKYKKLEQAHQKLSEKLGRLATEEEVAKELNLSLDELHKWTQDASPLTLLSLDEVVGEDSRLAELIEDETEQGPLEAVENKQSKEILMQALSELSEKEQEVLTLYYYEDLTLKEISAVLSISESRVCQIHSQSMIKLRSRLKNKLQD